MSTALETLHLLTSQMHLEPAEDQGCPKLAPQRKDDVHISSAQLPNGQRIKLLKSLLTSACERNCYYCPFRAGRDFRRATFKPDEMAHTFNLLHRAGAVEGIFLSSGIVQGGVTTQDKLIATAEILRRKYDYKGYLHLKIMPGAEKAQVEAAMRLADRVSINLEAPNTDRLALLAPRKQFTEELIQPLKWVQEIRRTQSPHLGWKGRWPSSVTQFVVGAVGENDLELLSTTAFLYQQLNLRRAYFSPFGPIPDTPLENQPPTPPIREARLYEASFLLRDYGFDLEELPFDAAGNLPLHADPKKAWAQYHLAEQPIELNRASKRELLRVPGIGPKSAAIILDARRQNKLTQLDDLKKLGIRAHHAAPYILLNGHRPAQQMAFWP
jgi:predicted DNA-binding helix-hairpin-helix protein